MLLGVPWQSTDASNWEANPGRFGKWKAFGGADLGLRSGDVDLLRRSRGASNWSGWPDSTGGERWRASGPVTVAGTLRAPAVRLLRLSPAPETVAALENP